MILIFETIIEGYSNINISEKVRNVYDYSYGENDWLTNESDDYIVKHISNMIEYSKRIKTSCEKYGIGYFDTSKNFMQVLDDAMWHLLK